ncbi:ankyrin repeat family protein [Turkeypox virus]|uniref:Ankyrin repeat family protein n=1 Tax=Turkeypox virus TaxID=336486 RepID=A0A0M3ZK40_9POXV|nr:ankyrin repeat family protein [Turkeypox virus]ALA62494.1 ankyrin repeat family protein [Turkeypox virus]
MDTKTLYNLMLTGTDDEIFSAIHEYEISTNITNIFDHRITLLYQAVETRRKHVVESLLNRYDYDDSMYDTYNILHILCNKVDVSRILRLLDVNDETINLFNKYTSIVNKMSLIESTSIELLKRILLKDVSTITDEEIIEMGKRAKEEDLSIQKLLIERFAVNKWRSTHNKHSYIRKAIRHGKKVKAYRNVQYKQKTTQETSYGIYDNDNALVGHIQRSSPLIFYNIVNTKDKYGLTPLHYCAKYGKLEMTTMLLGYGGDPRIMADCGISTFRYSVLSKNIDLVKELIKYYRFNDYVDGYITIIDAVCYKNIPMITYLLDMGLSTNIKDKQHKTPLHYAIDMLKLEDVIQIHNDNSGLEVLEIIRLLITRGADVNTKDMFHRSPLHYATKVPYFMDIISLLVNNGADVNSRDRYKKTPLHNVTIIPRKGDIITILDKYGINHNFINKIYDIISKVVKLLIERGADVNAKDRYNKTPLHNSTRTTIITDVIKALLEGGAKINQSDKYDKTPMYNIASSPSGSKIIKSLIDELRLDINERDEEGKSPLYRASKFVDCIRAVRIFLEYGADVNDNFCGITPLHNACSYKEGIAVAKLLLDNCANINAKDSTGRTPLHTACSLPADTGINIVKLLISYGANVHDKSADGSNCLHHAYNSPETVKLLLDHCVNINMINGYNKTPIETAVENIKSYNSYERETVLAAKNMVISLIMKAFKYPEIIHEPGFVKNMRVINDTGELYNVKISCESELEKIKSTVLDDNYNLDIFILTHDIDLLARLIKDKKLKDLDLNMFPIYNTFIKNIINVVANTYFYTEEYIQEN